MLIDQYLDAILMGLLEGLTEFLPVSSTGHLILLDTFLGFQGPPGKVFEVVIQLGAILAICVVYFARLWKVATGLKDDPGARRFVIAVLLAFLPAMVLGAGLHGIIKTLLFNPTVVSVALIVGGVAILIVERYVPEPRYHQIERFPAPLALKIGLCQCLALVPGVSRSGASILGALLMGVDRKAAAEFSFFLAVPTMAGATAYDLYKNWGVMNLDDAALIAVGFLTAFIAAALVVKTLVDFVGRYGFTPFGWYRIAIGSGMLAFLYL
ncbi:undecaprenyl-diphosphate phosphatase [Azospirillum doebereinerae]|uniref:Undecaprenyl-diphosphatase n=1 Tax=Azospirillum doebereinerae TaxID=92933 RepID=A0A3S1CE87_9PROT|nr:undecaprenyl-diphosphate phosphatase [Azospirillum doebereinerae]MCG5242273.1 undecaprenyl-diphosphate phosphatase [Azospirillum doebereinerae]RUQ65925.1 undecaprenyl-diphosphate phosphatase [Azospirillum doebereinerae]